MLRGAGWPAEPAGGAGDLAARGGLWPQLPACFPQSALRRVQLPGGQGGRGEVAAVPCSHPVLDAPPEEWAGKQWGEG